MDKDLVLLKTEMIKAYYKDNIESMMLKSTKAIIDNIDSSNDRCEYCGTKIIGNHTHCVSCGAPL